MRRAWWLGVLMVSCDFDAAYERRCDAGGCASVDAGAAGGAGGGATAGGQGGGATAGGAGGGVTAGGAGGGATGGGQGGGASADGGSSCATPLALEVNVMTPAPISATACVHLDIGLRCQGVRLGAGVPIDVRVKNTSNAVGRPATLFSNSTCSTSPSTVTTGDVYFNSTVAGQAHMFGTYEVVVDAGVSASRLVQLEPGIAGAPAMVTQPVNTCAPVPAISFVGLTDALPVIAPAEQRFSGFPSFPLLPCGSAVDLVVAAGQSTSSVMPGVSSLVASIAGFDFTLYGDAGQVSYLVRPCVPGGGSTSESSLCCTPPATILTDGGLLCP